MIGDGAPICQTLLRCVRIALSARSGYRLSTATHGSAWPDASGTGFGRVKIGNGISSSPTKFNVAGDGSARRYCRLRMNWSRHRRPARLPYSSVHVESPPLLQFVLLSMLLHVLFVAVFGSTTSGGARRGDSLLGSLDVTLRQISPERGSGFTLAPGAATNSPGAALLRRLEGSTTAPAALPQVKAATSAAPRETAGTSPVSPSSAATEVGESVPDVSLSSRPSPVEPLPRLDLNAPVEVDKPLISPTVLPPTVSPPVILPPREAVMPPIAPLERIAPAKIERQLAPSVELRQREVPIAPRTPPVELKSREEPIPTAAPVEPIAPAKIELEQTLPAEVKPRDVPLPPMTPIERIAPPKIERQFEPPVELQAPPRKAPVENTASDRALPAQIPARTESAAGGELPRLRFGVPDVDEEVFRSKRDVVAPSPEPGGTPGITAESLRRQAREIAREGSGSRGVLNFVPPPPPQERRDALAEGIAKAAKPDCRTAYAGMGLLAVVPLVASTVGNGGCRW